MVDQPNMDPRLKNRHVQAVMQAAAICKLRRVCGIPQPDSFSGLPPAVQQIVREFEAALQAASEAQRAKYDALLCWFKAETAKLDAERAEFERVGVPRLIEAAGSRLDALSLRDMLDGSAESEHDPVTRPNGRT
jgi:hypothetical protein